jgi:hypothetical protein
LIKSSNTFRLLEKLNTSQRSITSHSKRVGKKLADNYLPDRYKPVQKEIYREGVSKMDSALIPEGTKDVLRRPFSYGPLPWLLLLAFGGISALLCLNFWA